MLAVTVLPKLLVVQPMLREEFLLEKLLVSKPLMATIVRIP